MDSLWPDDIGTPGTTRAPVTILKEQAGLLADRTRGYVKAVVQMLDDYEAWMDLDTDVRLGFYLVAPTLGNYRYRLFAASYLLTNQYPVRFGLDTDMVDDVRSGGRVMYYDTVRTASSQEELLVVLGEILRSNKTKRVVQAILAQTGVELE